jgi:hypothetical protein
VFVRRIGELLLSPFDLFLRGVGELGCVLVES